MADLRSGTVPTQFFGHAARSTPLPAFIARRLDAPLIAARIVRTDGVNFCIDLEHIPVAKTANRQDDIHQATRALQKRFEGWISEFPGQWMWAHRRWTRRGPPKGWQKKTIGRLKSFRYFAEYAAFRTAVSGFRSLGIDRASALNGKLWELLAPHTKRHKTAMRHLSWAFPDKTPDERDAIARSVWNNLGRTTAEACLIDVFATDASRVRLTSPDVLTRIQDDAKGKVIIAPMHSGNWEVLAPVLTRYGLSGALIYQRVNNPYGEKFIRDTRLKYCAGGMFPKDNKVVRRLVSTLRAGKGVVILSDQRAKGAKPKFFGYTAPSTPLPAYLARNFDAPLIACRVVRTEGAHFELEMKEVQVRRSDDSEADIAQTTQDLQSVFEDWIREHPGQWMWAHRRWAYRGPPKDMPLPE
jgi:KDO2-lipid IV(A) lauroyltransferase